MSRRTVTRLALAGVFAAALAAPVRSQTPPRAPSPQPPVVSFGLPSLFQIDVDLDPTNPGIRPQPKGLLEVEFRIDFDSKPVAPMPRAKEPARDVPEWIGETQGLNPATPAPPLCAFDGPAPAAVRGPMPREVPQYGAVTRQVVVTPVCCPLTQATCSVTPPHPDMRSVYPYAGVTAIRCDENGTWWVKVEGVPQPKQPALCAPLGALIGSCQDCPAPVCTRSDRLSGTWAREIEGMVIAATFAGDEMKLCITQRVDCGEGECLTICATMTADYAVTKEGIVHGVITGVDVNTKSDGKSGGPSSFGAEIAEAVGHLQQVVDCPFSFRVKNTSVGMMVSGLKFAGFKELSGQELAPLCGLFQPCKDGRLPTPKPTQPRLTVTYSSDPELRFQRGSAPVPVGVCPPVTVCPAPCVLPAGGPGRCESGLPPCVAAPATPYPPCPPCLPPAPQVWNPPLPTNVPPNEFGMMAQAFGQMLGTPAGQPLCNPPVPVPVPVDAAFPVQTIGYPPPAPPCPVQPVGYPPCAPAPTVAQGPTVTRPPSEPHSLTGTWVREVGPLLYVVKFAPDHLTITASASTELPDGKTRTEGLVVSADYHLSRDGGTLVGLITGVDVVQAGSVRAEEFQDMSRELARLQKSLTDKPLALSVRVHGDELVIGNVRLPETKAEEGASPLPVLGGRYTPTDGPLPKPKVTKATLPCTPPACALPALGQPGPPIADYAPPPPYPAPEPGPRVSNAELLPSSMPAQPSPVRVAPPATAPGVTEFTSPSPAPGGYGVPPPPSAERIPPPAPSEPATPRAVRDKVQPTEMTILWRNRIDTLPDPSKNGAMNPGLVGQMFLLGSRDQAALAEGKLIVAVYDETPRPAGVAPCKLEGWEFDKEALKNLLTPDDRFGQSYALFLPWPSYGSDVTRIRIAARFEPEQGVAIYAAETKITLTSPQLGADRIPAAPASAPADTPKPGKKKGKKKNAANEQIRQLLQQSEDLRQIQNEWRRFWFNDQPGHLTPERIHGGIQP